MTLYMPAPLRSVVHPCWEMAASMADSISESAIDVLEVVMIALPLKLKLLDGRWPFESV